MPLAGCGDSEDGVNNNPSAGEKIELQSEKGDVSMQSDELKRRISAGRGDALADLVLKNSKTQTEYIRHHRCSAAESRSGCFFNRR